MVKNIAIMDCVYEDLVKRKRPDESFSNEITRLIGKKKSIMDLAGSWKISEEDVERMKSTIKKMREDTDHHVMKKVGLIR